MPRPTVAITIGKQNYKRMFNQAAWAALASFADVIHHAGDEPATKKDLLALLPNADACITSWDVAALDADVLAAAPRLKAMAHMGGSVKRFVSDVVWARGIRVTTAGPALAHDVAETTVGLMIVGIKHVVQLAQHVRAGGWVVLRHRLRRSEDHAGLRGAGVGATPAGGVEAAFHQEDSPEIRLVPRSISPADPNRDRERADVAAGISPADPNRDRKQADVAAGRVPHLL